MFALALVPLLLSLVGFVRTSPEISVVTVQPEEYTPDTQIVKSQLNLLTNVTRLVLHCKAHYYPVQWKYDGVTSPLQVEVRAVRKSGPKLSDPTFIAELVVYRVSASITGTYRCQSVLNPVKETTVHIYAHEKGYRGTDPVLLNYGTTVNISIKDGESILKFPCAVWNPSQTIHLYKLSGITGKYELQKTDGVSVEFDPKEGFRLNLNAMTDKPQGSYMCAPQLQRTFDRVYVNVFEKPDYRISPEKDFVEVPEGQALILRCEAVVEIKWNILGGLANDSRLHIKTESHPDTFYSHVSTLTFSQVSVADGTEIQCTRAKDASVIHSWSYQVVGMQDVKRRGFVKFFSRRTGMDCFACWARTSQSPDVNFVECKNPMECQIRGQCLHNEKNCDPAYVRHCAGGCALASIENKTGILQCKGNGIFQEIRQFVGISGSYFYNSVKGIPRDEQLGLNGAQVIKAGASHVFTCTGSSFLFASGFRWGLKSQGNPVRVLEPTSSEVISFQETLLPSGNIQAKAVLLFESPKITQLSCFAPSWNTTDWDSRTLRIFIKD